MVEKLFSLALYPFVQYGDVGFVFFGLFACLMCFGLVYRLIKLCR